MDVIGVCLALAAVAGEPRFVPVTRFTLAWTHSIERQRWEEDYAVLPAGATGDEPVLHAVAARVRGSGAGMEPPAGAVLRDGWYHYRPAVPTHEQLRLTRSTHTADYEWCVDGHCRPLGQFLPSDGDVTLLRACRARDTTR